MGPRVEYAQSGDVNIAYTVAGEGPTDLVFVPGFISHLEIMAENPTLSRSLEALTRFARVILFDKRGTGMSDPVAEVATLEERMDDVRAVMDAVGCERAALMGVSEGAPMCLLFAITGVVVLVNSFALATRPGAVPELGERIRRGTYEVDPTQVAEAMLRRPGVRRLLLGADPSDEVLEAGD